MARCWPACRAATTTAVAADCAVLEPSELLAVTRNRSVWPSSAAVSWYCVPVAPLIASQPPPLLEQRSQALSYFVGLFVQDPRSPVRIWPMRATPTIRGGDVFVGFALAAARPDPTATAATAAVTAPRESGQSRPARRSCEDASHLSPLLFSCERSPCAPGLCVRTIDSCKWNVQTSPGIPRSVVATARWGLVGAAARELARETGYVMTPRRCTANAVSA